jgi:AraC-like DNA-binding protein
VIDAHEEAAINYQPQVTFLVRHPRPPLSDLIDFCWYYEAGMTPREKELHLPSGAMQLLINLCDDEIRVYGKVQHEQGQRLRGIALCGMYSEPFVIDSVSQSAMMGVCFKPEGAFPFLPLPASELLNLHISVEDVWGDRADRLYERLLGAPTPATKLYVLEQALMAQLYDAREGNPAISAAVRAIQQAECVPSMREISESLGMSHKHFIHLFKQQVGLSPKIYARLQRFQTALKSMNNGGMLSWSELALSAGYFDQAHFIHDFREFAGVTPMTYAEQRMAGHNHVRITE